MSSTQGRGRDRVDAARIDRHTRRGAPRRRVPVRPPSTGAGAVRRALPPRRVRGRVDHPRGRRGVPLRPPPQGVDGPSRGDHPARSGRARPPVRLAGVGAADADPREDAAPAAAVCVQRRGDLPPVSRDRYPAAVRDVQPGAGRPGAVPGPLRHRAAHLRSAQPATARSRRGPRDARGARRQEPRAPHRARHPAPRRHAGGYIAAAHPDPEPAHHLFHTGDPATPADKSTIYNRLRRYLADADIPHFPGRPAHPFAASRVRGAEPAPLGGGRQRPGGDAALPIRVHGARRPTRAPSTTCS